VSSLRYDCGAALKSLKEVRDAECLAVLARTSLDSLVHSRIAAEKAGWIAPGEDFLSLGTLKDALHSVGFVKGLNVVTEVRHPYEPRSELMDSLVMAPPGVIVDSVIEMVNEWSWFGRDSEVSQVILDQNAFLSCEKELLQVGVPYRLVHSSTAVSERVKLSERGDVLLLEKGSNPVGWSELRAFPAMAKSGYFGRITKPDFPMDVSARRAVWLSFLPSDDHSGSLSSILLVLADLGLDLSFIRSFPVLAGGHGFHTVFSLGPGQNDFESVVQEALGPDVEVRITGQFVVPSQYEPPPTTLEPVWDSLW
jgi:hypothetical protein